MKPRRAGVSVCKKHLKQRAAWPTTATFAPSISDRHLEDLIALAILLEESEAIIADDRRALHPPLVLRVHTAHGVQHAPVVPDHHVVRLPRMEVRMNLGDHLLAHRLEQRVALGVLVVLYAHSHPG